MSQSFPILLVDEEDREPGEIHMSQAVIGLFDSFAQAQTAVNDLISAGFSRDDISVVANNVAGEFDNVTAVHDGINVSQGTGDLVKGAVRGGLYGGLTALAATVAIALIPGIGPIAAVGPLTAFLAGAGVGAAAGGIIGALTGLGVPEAEAGFYAEGIRRGGTLITVHTSDSRAIEARDILNRHSPVNINRRSEYYRSTGFDRYDTTLPAYTPEQIATDRARYADYARQYNTPLTTTESTYNPITSARTSVTGVNDINRDELDEDDDLAPMGTSTVSAGTRS